MLRLQTGIFCATEEPYEKKNKGGIKTVLILLTLPDSLLNLACRFRCYHTFQLSLRLQGQMEGAEHLKSKCPHHDLENLSGFYLCYSHCFSTLETYFSL